jgi:hypothetical protein
MAGSRAPLESASAATPLSDNDRLNELCIENKIFSEQFLPLIAAEVCSRQFQFCYVLQTTKALFAVSGARKRIKSSRSAAKP